MEGLKPCPFCGGGQYSHEDWCFILMCMVNEEQAMFGNKRLFTEEDLANAWNRRAERTCRIVPHGHLFTLSDGTELYESACSECGAYLGDEDNYCSICGAKVIEEEA